MKNPSYLAIPFVLITALALLPSGCVALFGGFSSKVVLSLSVTPDLRLDLTKRASFPAKEFIDPAVKLDALLIEERSSDIIARATVKLSEDSDYVTPRLTIAGGRAVLSGFDRRTPAKELSLALPRH